MSLHPLAQRFADVADAYERGRPEYAPAAIGALMGELGLRPGSRVLDLAAGTGKLTRALVGAGLDVVAVEPQAELRELLAASVGADRVREGLAESIPLGDDSVAAVTVADGFHWFDQAAALGEIARVVEAGGGLAILSTFPDWSGASWAADFGGLMEEMLATRPEHPFFDGPPWSDAVHAAGDWDEIREVRVTTNRPAQPERIADYLGSMSWVAAMPAQQRADALKRIDEVVAAGETPAELPIHVVIGLAALKR